MNLYEIFGVRRNASHEAIKKAFRARVKTAHPDAGGTADEFRLVHLAWRVLSDPERRRRYDETGQVEDLAADTAEAKVLSVVAWAFGAALEQLGKRGADLVHSDMIAEMRSALSRRASEASNRATRLSSNRKALSQLLGRFDRRSDGPNLLEEMLSSQIIEIDRMLEKIDEDRRLVERAAKLLEDYSFRYERVMRTMMMGSTSTNSTTSFTSW